MQKVYLLLRNNEQSGPYSFDELVQNGLRSFDLVWVEGKSAGWCYPSEVEALKPYVQVEKTVQNEQPPNEYAAKTPSVPHDKIITPKNIFVSLPAGKTAVPKEETFNADPLEQKAEELRKRALAYTLQTQLPKEPAATNYTRSLETAEEEYTGWLYNQKTKKKSIKGKQLLLSAFAIAAVIIGGGWVVKKAFFNTSSLPNTVAIQQNTIPGPGEKNISMTDVEATPGISINNVQKAPLTAIKKLTVKKETEIKRRDLDHPNTAAKDVAVKTEPAVQEDNNTIAAVPQKNIPPPVAPAKEKKKTFKETINDLFKKKNSEPVKDPGVAENAGERTARHRNDAPTEERATIDLAEQVQIRSNQTGENWMLGVQGLKLTLINRSNSTVEKAAVEVVYYNEQNAVLEKKILSCANIGPKKTTVLVVPDNRMADRAEYKLLSATGSQEGMQSNNFL